MSENNQYVATCLPKTYALFSQYIARVQQELDQVKEQAIERKTVNNDYFFEIADRVGLLNIDLDVDMDSVPQLQQLSVNIGNFADYLVE